MPLPLRKLRAENSAHSRRDRLLFDFFPGRPSTDLFPLKPGAGCCRPISPTGVPRVSANTAIRRGFRRFAPRSPTRCLGGVARHLRGSRRPNGHRLGHAGRTEHLCAAVPGARLAQHCRGSLLRGAASAFEAAGAEVAGVAVDRDGLVAGELPQLAASLFYLTPSHQYPTGTTLSQRRRIDIMAWARRYGCYIIEDDYDCDIRYEGSHLDRSPPRRRTAQSISALSRNPLAADCGWASWWCRNRSPKPLAPKRPC